MFPWLHASHAISWVTPRCPPSVHGAPWWGAIAWLWGHSHPGTCGDHQLWLSCKIHTTKVRPAHRCLSTMYWKIERPSSGSTTITLSTVAILSNSAPYFKTDTISAQKDLVSTLLSIFSIFRMLFSLVLKDYSTTCQCTHCANISGLLTYRKNNTETTITELTVSTLFWNHATKQFHVTLF